MMRTFVYMICVGSLFALSAKAIDPLDVKAAIDAGEPVTLIDVRNSGAYRYCHIAGAINIPAQVCELKKLPPLGRVIVYGDGLKLARTDAAADALNAKDGIEADVLDGGITKWQEMGLPCTDPKGPGREETPSVSYQQLSELVPQNPNLVGVIVIPAGQTSEILEAQIVDDGDIENNETFTIEISDPDSTAAGDITEHTYMTIDNDGAPSISFVGADRTVGEDAGSITIEVLMSQIIGSDVQFGIDLDGTAANSADFAPDSTNLTIVGGEDRTSITLDIEDDALNEGNETIVLTLSPPGNANLGLPSTVTVTITDNDPLPTIAFTETASNDAEAQTKKTFLVQLSEVSGRDVIVEYAVIDGTAVVVDDYNTSIIPEHQVRSVTIPAAATTADIAITIVDDTLDEAEETFTISLSNPTNATFGAQVGHTYTIIDDDAAPAVDFAQAMSDVDENVEAQDFDVALSTASGRDITVLITVASGSATINEDFTERTTSVTIAAGELTAAYSVDINDDSVYETDETFRATIGSADHAAPGSQLTHDVTILDDEDEPQVTFTEAASTGSEAVTPASINIELSGPSALPVEVTVDVAGDTATIGEDFGPGPARESVVVTFAALSVAESVEVAINDDTKDELDETFTLTLESPDNAALGSILTHTHTIEDNDDPSAVGFTFAISSGSEGLSPATVRVELSEESGFDVSVDYSTVEGTATSGADYVTTSGRLTIPSGQLFRNIPVDIVDDIADEATENFTVVLSSPTNATLDVATHTRAIIDNEAPPIIHFATAASAGDENITPAALTVTLNRIVAVDVTVAFAVSGGDTDANDFALAPTTVTIPAGILAQDFEVVINDDEVVEAEETFVLEMTAPSGASIGVLKQHTYTINDNDIATGAFTSWPPTGAVDIRSDAELLISMDAAPLAMETVTAVQAQAVGPDYTCLVGKYTVSVREFVAALNIYARNEGSNVMFDDDGNAFFASLDGIPLFEIGENNDVMEPTGADDKSTNLFSNDIAYNVEANSPFTYPNSSSNFPILGTTWYGAVMFCNQLSLRKGVPEAELAYHVGPAPGDWRPRNLSTAQWADGFSTEEREAWLDGYPDAFRLPMDGYEAGASRFNEFYWAATGPDESPYGTDGGGNFWDSGDYFEPGLTPNGYFPPDSFGLDNMSGNTWEWMTDTFEPGSLTQRAVRSGSWYNLVDLVTPDQRYGIAPQSGFSDVGFRVVCKRDYRFQIELSTASDFDANVQRNYTPARTQDYRASRQWKPALQPNTQYYWRVRAYVEGGEDATPPWSGELNTFVPYSTFTTSPQTRIATQERNIPAGWNLFSLPADPVTTHSKHLFGYDATIWSWDSGLQQYKQPYTIKPFQAFWLLMPDRVEAFEIETYTALSTIVAFRRGWNLVGPLVNDTVIPRDQVINEKTVNFIKGDITRYIDGEYVRSDDLDVGLGHWVFTVRKLDFDMDVEK